ncbi:hypothetical protein [Methylobacterium oryzae]|uniref:hypothetical protein n=1 Tax=Methylobacterium oryzae TaxID=334852 RepID=UPI002F2CC860
MTIIWNAIKAGASWANQKLAWIAVIGIAISAFLWLQKHDADIRKADADACTVSRQAATIDAQNQTLNIKRRQDEIRNAPRSDALTAKRLRSHTF